MSFSRWLTQYKNAIVNVSKENPLSWRHGEHDNKVLFDLHKIGAKKLKKWVIDAEVHSCDIQYSACPEEM